MRSIVILLILFISIQSNAQLVNSGLQLYSHLSVEEITPHNGDPIRGEWPICPSPTDLRLDTEKRENPSLHWTNDLNKYDRYEVKVLVDDIEITSILTSESNFAITENVARSSSDESEVNVLVRRICYDEENGIEIPSEWSIYELDTNAQNTDPDICDSIFDSITYTPEEDSVRVCIGSSWTQETIEYVGCWPGKGKYPDYCRSWIRENNSYSPWDCFKIPNNSSFYLESINLLNDQGESILDLDSLCNDLDFPVEITSQSNCQGVLYTTPLNSEFQLFYYPPFAGLRITNVSYNYQGQNIDIAGALNGPVTLPDCSDLQILIQFYNVKTNTSYSCPIDYSTYCNATSNCLIGSACNDGDPCTVNDTYDSLCNCEGIMLPDSDNDGICDEEDLCPNGNDTIDSDGDDVADDCDDCPQEAGQLANGCNNCDLQGQACNDGDPCTENDLYDSICDCQGTLLPDSDNDGICDSEDICSNGDDSIDSDNDGIPDDCDDCPQEAGQLANGCNNCDLQGQACNDGDPCTVNDIYNENCGCSGTFLDTDGDGVCNENDDCPDTPGSSDNGCSEGTFDENTDVENLCKFFSLIEGIDASYPNVLAGLWEFELDEFQSALDSLEITYEDVDESLSQVNSLSIILEFYSGDNVIETMPVEFNQNQEINEDLISNWVIDLDLQFDYDSIQSNLEIVIGEKNFSCNKDETILVIDEEEIELPKLECGIEYTFPSDIEEIEFDVRPGEITHIKDFPVLVTSIQSINMTTGATTGKGLMLLPFKGNKVVHVDINEIIFNLDHVAVGGGSITGTSGYEINDLPQLDIISIDVDADMCKEPPVEVNDQSGGFDPLTGLNAYGFYEDGTHYQTGTLVNGYGFDINGIHEDTGENYDLNGCTIDNVHFETGEPCNDNEIPPVIHQIFIDSILNESNGVIPDSLISHFNQIQQDIEAILNIDCTSLLTELQALPLNGIPSNFYYGENDELIGEDLVNHFTRKPQTFYVDESQRDPIATQREALHISYYNCIDSFTIYQSYFATIQELHPSNDAESLQNLIDYVKLNLENVDNLTFQYIQDPVAFSNWLLLQIQSYISENTNVPDYGIIPSINNEAKDQWVGLSSQYASTTKIETFKEDKLEELLFQYEQGFDIIGGIERPFITEALYKAKSASTSLNSDLNSALPLAITNVKEGYSYTIYIDNITVDFDNDAVIDAAIVVTDANSGKKIAFAGSGIPLDPSGVGDSAKLWLLSDQELPINNTSKLVIVGTNDSTYINFDCTGFVGGSIEARVEFCSNYITPIDSSGEPNNDLPYTFSFITKFSKWLDFSVSAIGDPFILKPLPNYKWSMDSLTLDFSALNNTFVDLPLGYSNNQYITDSTGVGGYFVPDWRGFHLKGLQVTLPPQLQTNTQVTVGIENAVFDRYGFTGEAFVQKELIKLGEGDMDGWSYSVDRLHIIILQNKIRGGGFGGKLGISIAEHPFDYTATIVAKNNYQFKVENTEESNSFPVFKAATVTLEDNSNIHATYTEDFGFAAVANLSGTIEISLDSFPDFNLPSVKFQKLRVSNKPDYLEAGKWGVQGFVPGSAPQWNAFGISVDSIYPYKYAEDAPEDVRLGINFSVDVIDSVLVAKGGIDLIGNLVYEGQYQKYKYNSLEFRHFCIEGSIKDRFYIDGCVEVYKNDDNFGDGWRGGVHVIANISEQLGNFEAVAAAQFGKVGNHKYFFVDVLVDTGAGIPLGPLTFTKLGGGLSKGMYPNYDAIDPLLLGQVIDVGELYNYPLGTTLTGIPYLPDPAWGLEFKLMSEFQFTANSAMCNGTGELKFRFNATGGLGEIELLATAKMLETPNFVSGFATNTVGGVFDAANNVLPQIESLEAPSLDAKLSGYLSLKMNFNEGVFDGDFAVFLVGQNIHGYNDNKSMAWSKMHFSSDDWYIWIGTPTEPCGIKMNTLIFDTEVTAYFDVGTIVPTFPGLPDEVSHLAKDLNISESQRSSGKGIAFGASINASLNVDAGIVELEANIGGGFDILIRQYNEALCNGSDDFGINNWYAMGQFWAYINGSIKAFGFNVAEAGITGLLQVQGPNPTYLYGAVEVYYNTPLGSGRKVVDLEIGEPCEWEFSNPADEIGMDLIVDLTPFDNMDNLEVVIAPNASLAISTKWSENINGKTYEFVINPDSTGVFWRNSKMASIEQQLNSWGNGITFKPETTLPANDSFYVKVMLDVYQDGEFMDSQSKIHRFQTGDNLDHIPESNIVTSYPVNGMMNFHRAENPDKQFFMYLDIGQPSLLENSNIVGKVCDSNMNCFESPITYYSNDHAVYFDVDPGLMVDQMNYMFYLKDYNATPQELEEGEEEDPSITDGRISPKIYFRTSMYPTFFDKMITTTSSVSQEENTVRDINTSGLIYVQFDGEPYDEIELNERLVRLENPGSKAATGLDKFYNERFPVTCPTIKFSVPNPSFPTPPNNQISQLIANQESFEQNLQLSPRQQTFGTSIYWAYDQVWSGLTNQFSSYFAHAAQETLQPNTEDNKKLWLGNQLYNDYHDLGSGAVSTNLTIRYVLPNGVETTNSANFGYDYQYNTTSDVLTFLSKF